MKNRFKVRIWDEEEQRPVFKAKGKKEHILKDLEGFFQFK